ncbi:hypothetical protein MRB53_014356 [Persea americana]|uniref:Uncharacterized protein n=1 Tax=Persea americana TaxID=3435 RepID=A0ACC2KAP5_PERAE|nr:hypothetical protein MRB53_014356 [Persea americana]
MVNRHRQPAAPINTRQHKDLLQEMQRLRDEIQFLRDPIIKKYGGFRQEASSSNGSVNNKDDSDATMPPSKEAEAF